jgi:hypothetical protein
MRNDYQKILFATSAVILLFVAREFIISQSALVAHSTVQPIYVAVDTGNQTYTLKDNKLKSLLAILNSQQSLYKNWLKSNLSDNEAYSTHYAELLFALQPWLIGEPPEAFLLPEYPLLRETDLNCADSRYKSVFTGSRLSKPRVIVDFIPFGYDVDKLEIRLIENFDAVDAFVLFESELTQTG